MIVRQGLCQCEIIKTATEVLDHIGLLIIFLYNAVTLVSMNAPLNPEIPLSGTGLYIITDSLNACKTRSEKILHRQESFYSLYFICISLLLLVLSCCRLLVITLD